MNNLTLDPARWATYQYKSFMQQAPAVCSDIETGENKNHAFGDFTREVFERLYSADVVSNLADEEITPENKWAKDAHSQAANIKEWKETLDGCANDKMWSGITAAKIAKHLIDAGVVPDQTENERRSSEDARQAVESAIAEHSMASAAGASQEALQQLAGAVKSASENYDRIANGISSEQSSNTDIRNAMREALKEACEEKADEDEGLRAFGFSLMGTGNKVKLDSDARKKLAESMKSDRLKEIVKLAGRMIPMAGRKQATKTDYARSEVASVEVGNDIERILPSDLAMLSDADTEDIFFQKYAERKLLQYKMTGKDKLKSGPIVMAIDNSGSMEGEREVWSKAVALAMLTIAKQQKRPFYAIHFNSRVMLEYSWIPGSKEDPAKLIDFICDFYGGGTDVQVALDHCLNVLYADPTYKKSDVVLITDGVFSLRDEWIKKYNEEKKETAHNLYAVLLGTNEQRSLKAIGATQYSLMDLVDENVSGELFANV